MRLRNGLLLVACALASLVGTGCGKLTIRTWVQVIEAESDGSIFAPTLNPEPYPVTQLEGGFLGAIELDTRDIPAPLQGTLAIDDIRIAGDAGVLLGKICIWGNPAQPSSGTVLLNLLGDDSNATATLNVLATTGLSQMLQIPPAGLSQTATFPLGGGLSLDTFINAGLSGNTDGLFATSAAFEGESELAGAPVTFSLDITVTNLSTPPSFDAAQLQFCSPFFNQQGRDLYYGMNVKGSYLRAIDADNPTAPLIIKLSDHGIVPGNRVKLARIGRYSDITQLQDGDQTRLTGVFSSSNLLGGKSNRNRVTGAINAGTDITTAPYWNCIIWPLCWQTPTDISQDFRIDPEVTLTVPTGAQYLMVAPLPSSYIWGDNLGFGFGVTIEVVP
jgi:hypothetical protein